MKRAVVLTHVPHEGPGRLAKLLVQNGYALDVLELHGGTPVPARVAREDLLIVMGGPMGVEDAGRPEFPFLGPEIALLTQRIEENAPVLGICLGAQLLAAASGAAVYPMKRSDGERLREVGWGPVQFHRTNTPEPVLDGLPAEVPVLHWHGDTFDLPAGAELLASSAVCKHQAYRLGSKLFGLQFHCETTAEDVERFLDADGDYVTLANGPSGVERLRADTARCLPEFGGVGERLLENIVRAMSAG